MRGERGDRDVDDPSTVSPWVMSGPFSKNHRGGSASESYAPATALENSMWSRWFGAPGAHSGPL